VLSPVLYNECFKSAAHFRFPLYFIQDETMSYCIHLHKLIIIYTCFQNASSLLYPSPRKGKEAASFENIPSLVNRSPTFYKIQFQNQWSMQIMRWNLKIGLSYFLLNPLILKIYNNHLTIIYNLFSWWIT